MIDFRKSLKDRIKDAFLIYFVETTLKLILNSFFEQLTFNILIPLKEIEAEVKEDSTFERILNQGMDELEALKTPVQAPTPSEDGQPTQFDKIKQNGETYINAFDFFQRFQRWMYEHGLFNFNGFGAA